VEIMLGHAIDSINVNIRQVENGYVLTVNYPNDMIQRPMDPTLVGMQEGINSFIKKKEAGGTGPEDLLELFSSTIKKANDRPEKPLRKPMEEYVFSDLEKAMNYIREVFSSDCDA